MRNKLELSYIANDSRRKATLKKRKRGILKKMSELTTLCDITGCAIIYSTPDSQPEVWPSPDLAQQVVSELRLMPETAQSRQRVNHEGFLEKRISKASEQLSMQKEVNREKEVTRLIFQGITGRNLPYMDLQDLRNLNSAIDKNMEEVNKKRQASVAEGGAEGTVVVVAEPPETQQFQFGGGTGEEMTFSDVNNFFDYNRFISFYRSLE